MTLYVIIILANLLVGGMISLTGIAGFLLPMLYSGFLGMSASQGLALSFFAFLISGVLGSYNYYKAKNLDLKLALIVSAGSLIGAALGVRLNLLIDEEIVKRILYLVVLASGISILFRKEKKEEGKAAAELPGRHLCGIWSGNGSFVRSFRGRRTDPGHAASGGLWRAGQNCSGSGAV